MPCGRRTGGRGVAANICENPFVLLSRVDKDHHRRVGARKSTQTICMRRTWAVWEEWEDAVTEFAMTLHTRQSLSELQGACLRDI